MDMGKKKILTIMVILLFCIFTITCLYKLIGIIKYSECENYVFSNKKYLGGDNFEYLHKECIEKRSILKIIKEKY